SRPCRHPDARGRTRSCRGYRHTRLNVARRFRARARARARLGTGQNSCGGVLARERGHRHRDRLWARSRIARRQLRRSASAACGTPGERARHMLRLCLCLALAGCVSDVDGDAELDVSPDSLRETVTSITTISYAPNSYVIGNAYPGWTDIVQGAGQESSGPGNPNGADYRWGYLFGEHFDRCAWINNNAI